jgi:hypothetical protein
VGAVDDRQRSRLARTAAELCDVVDAAARPFDVRAEDDARARPGVELRERASNEGGARAFGDVLPEQLHAAVLGVAEKHLVARVQLERPCDRVQRGARVRGKSDVGGARSEQVRETDAGGLDQLREAPFERQELHGLSFELALEPLVGLEYGRRAGTERAVIEEHHAGVEEKLFLDQS